MAATACSILRCSTPSGIRGGFTVLLPPSARVAGLGAQRLPASEAASRPEIAGLMRKHACSTPSGIRGGFTHGGGAVLGYIHVLNAFRHQRRLHQLDHAAGQPLRRVLNAFRHQRRLHPWRHPVPHDGAVCSTPSGIRGGFTSVRTTARAAMRSVLNAFRHQRRLHIMVGTRHRSRCGAQRLPASEAASPQTVASKIEAPLCSTPSGIRGGFTYPLGTISTSPTLCSTPSGIRGGFTCAR